MPRKRERDMANNAQSEEYIEMCWRLRMRGMDVGEIAALVGIHRNTMSKRISRQLPITYEAYLALKTAAAELGARKLAG